MLGLRVGETISQVRDRKDLKFLLSHEDRRRETDIDGISMDMVDAMQAEIPSDFLIYSGLIEFNWQQIFHPNGLSSVYLGADRELANPLRFEDAEAVIAIHSEVRHGEIKPNGVEISLVLNDSRERPRIVNSWFAALSSTEVRRYISFSDTEKFEQPAKHWWPVSSDDLLLPKLHIPTFPDRFFVGPFANPLISSKMSELANGDSHIVCVDPKGINLTYRYLENTGEQFVTSQLVDGKKQVTAWSIDFPKELDFREYNRP